MLVVLAGRCGAGKTAAAVHWSRRHRQLFIDGQLFINLHGSSERTRPTQPLDGLRLILGSLGVTEGQIPRNVDAAVCLYRTLVADRHILVLLDDARDTAQIRPLLPGGAGSAVLITGRNNLSDLLTREGAVHVDIGGLDRAPARAILVAALGRQRVDAESAAADEIARQCGNLPLVLKLAANELLTKPRRTLTGFAAAMRRNGTAEILNASRNVAELQAALGAV